MGPHVTERLSAYMDGELPEAERLQVDAHLRACPACAGHLDELHAVEAAARALPLEVPEGYFEAFPGRLRQRLAASRRRRAVLVPAWIGAAAAAVVLALVTPRLLLRDRAAPSPPAAAPAADRDAPAAAKTDALARAGGDARPRMDQPLLRTEAPARAPAANAAPPQPAEGRPAAPPPAATGTLAREKKEADELRALGYAAAPPAQGLEPKPQAQARAEAESAPAAASTPAAEEQKLRQDKTTRGAVASGERVAGAAGPEDRSQSLAKRKVSTAAEARVLRDAWRALARDEPEGPRADEARVRAIEAGAEAWRRGRDEKDRAEALREGREYLARADALQPDRVRAALKTLAP